MGHVSRIKHTGDGEGFAMSFDNGNNHSSGVAGIPFLYKKDVLGISHAFASQN
jgi:hypothetical protein